MLIPKLQGLVDEIALQKSLALLLCDNTRLAQVPILPEIKLLEENELLVDALWTLPRSAFTITTDGWTVNQNQTGGLCGGGVLIEIPEMMTRSAGVSGPVATWKIGIVGMAELNTAFVTGVGIGFTSSQLCQIALDQLQHQNIYSFGTFETDSQGIQFARDWVELKPGISAHRINLLATVGRVQSTRSTPATVSITGGNCTLACTDGAATILYTLDGTVPTKSNPSTVAYSVPFPITSGQTVMFMTEKANTINSQILGAVAP